MMYVAGMTIMLPSHCSINLIFVCNVYLRLRSILVLHPDICVYCISTPDEYSCIAYVLQIKKEVKRGFLKKQKYLQ